MNYCQCWFLWKRLLYYKHCCKLHTYFPHRITYMNVGISNCKTIVKSESPVFWDITPCSPLKVNRRFGGTCRVYLLWNVARWKQNPVRKFNDSCEVSSAQICLLPAYTAWLVLRPWRLRWHIPPKLQFWLFDGLHGFISQKTGLICNHQCQNLKSYAESRQEASQSVS
jgi:hypothetical protein